MNAAASMIHTSVCKDVDQEQSTHVLMRVFLNRMLNYELFSFNGVYFYSIVFFSNLLLGNISIFFPRIIFLLQVLFQILLFLFYYNNYVYTCGILCAIQCILKMKDAWYESICMLECLECR